MPISRRVFTASVLFAAGASRSRAQSNNISDALRERNQSAFLHGVASGDPLEDRIILWTRVTPTAATKPVRVRWRVATDSALTHIVNQGEAQALAQRDFTVKVDATGLAPGRAYYYQFDADGYASPIGRTRTLPSGIVTRLRLAMVSCSNLPFGYFNVYANIAARSDLDAVLHLGDYIYEYGPKEWGDGSEFNRSHQPAHELLTLGDYRQRHAQYKRDIDLQEAHRQHPWITVWDDHETADNAWRDGAKNHNPDKQEGDWRSRKAAGIQAYAEWMPIREVPDEEAGLRSWRRFAFGDLVDLLMLDTRLHGRSEQVAKADAVALANPARSLLGVDQETWLAAELRRSKQRKAPFRLLGQQVMFGQLLDADRHIVNSDMWDGYPVARQRIFDQLAAEKIDGVVLLSGDIHSAWALDLTPAPFDGYDAYTGRGSLAVEMITTSVTSPSPYGSGDAAAQRELSTLQNGPHLKFTNFRQRGYLLLDVTPERAQGEWYFVDSISTRGSADVLGAALAVARGETRLQRVANASSPNPDRAPSI